MTQIAYRIAAAAAALVLLTACGDDDDDTTAGSPSGVEQPLSTPAATTTPKATDASAEPSADSASSTVAVDMTDFKLKLDRTSFQAGKYTFTAKNSGTYPHAFQIDGPGIENQGTGNVAPGDTGSMTVTLQKGEYYFYCPVEGHQGKGMEMYVTVT